MLKYESFQNCSIYNVGYAFFMFINHDTCFANTYTIYIVQLIGNSQQQLIIHMNGITAGNSNHILMDISMSDITVVAK